MPPRSGHWGRPTSCEDVPVQNLLGLSIPPRAAPRNGQLRSTVGLELGLLTLLPLLGSALHYGLG
mgnify:CR=1 FL=1